MTPTWLAPDFRFAGDDWSGANALTYVVYSTAPVYASDGITIVTPGVPRDLTGFTVSGNLRRYTTALGIPLCRPAWTVTTMQGAIVDALNGVISLSLPAAQTIFPTQPFSAWGDPGNALCVAQPKVVDSQSEAVTVGLQPLFVF